MSCAATSHLRIYKDKAIAVTDCGDIWVLDLPGRKIERIIPSYAHFYAVTIMDGLIFTAPTSEPRPKDAARVFDLYSGKELATLPINATDLFAVGDRLLAVERKFMDPSPISVYRIDVAALRNGEWRKEKVLKDCDRAAQLVSTGDLYGALDLCRSTGVESMVDEVRTSPGIRDRLGRHAIRLGQTLDGARDAVRLLEALEVAAPDPWVRQALVEAQLRARVMDGEPVTALTAGEQATEFGRALELAPRSQLGRSFDIDFGAFSNLIHFSGSYVFVGRYGTRRDTHSGGASVGVFDRSSFDELASIPIAGDDPSFQDAVASMTSDDRHLYVRVGYRDEDEGKKVGRPNFFVVDKQTLKVLRSAVALGPSSLFMHRNKLLACDCDEDVNPSCHALDPATGKTTEEPQLVCLSSRTNQETAVVGRRLSLEGGSSLLATTKDYLVAGAGHDRRTSFLAYPRSGVGQPVALRFAEPETLESVLLTDGNVLLLAERQRQGLRVKQLSLPSGAVRTLFGMPTTQTRVPIFLAHGPTLFVGLGRDLLLFDLKDGQLFRYLQDFISGGFADNGHGLDSRRIDRLLVDRDHLIALTFSGAGSRIVPLHVLPAAK